MTEALFWDNLAERYAARPVEDPDAFDRKIAITRDHMTRDSIVADLGCGTGSLALRLADAAGHVYGIDFSPQMLRIADEKLCADGATNVSFHLSTVDGSCDVLEPGSVDVLCAYSILHLVPDLQDALKRMFALVKPGGVLVSSTVVLGESWVPYRPMLGLMKLMGRAPEVAIIDKQTLATHMRAAGFVDVQQPDVGAKPIIGFMVARKPVEATGSRPTSGAEASRLEAQGL